MKFGDKLTKLRRQKGLSQEELGNSLNVTRQTISKWELNQSKPDTDKLMEISKLLDVDFNQLANDELKIETITNNNTNYSDPQPRKWLLILLILVAIIIVVVLANKIITDRKTKEGGISQFFNNFFSNFETITEDNNFDIKSFNNSLESYSGTQSGFFVENLIDNIITSNKTNKEHLIEVVYKDTTTKDPEEIKNIKSNIDTSVKQKYEVSFDYDDEGYIIKATIEEYGPDVDDFNRMLELRSGTQYNTSISYLLDDVITSNKKYPNYLIEVTYQNKTTKDETEIRNIKKSLEDWTEYEVILNYNESGYVYQIVIEK